MNFSVDTYPWWDIYFIPAILFSIALLFSMAYPLVSRYKANPYPPNNKPSIARTEARKTISFVGGFIAFMSLFVALWFTVMAPNALLPWASNQVTASVAEVTLSPSETQPDKLCYTLDNQSSCVDRDDIPAELKLTEPALVLTVGDDNIITTTDVSDEELEKQVTKALDIPTRLAHRVHLMER